MITKIQIIIIVLSLLDLTASYFYITMFHNKFPNQDPTIIEANPILKMSIQNFGINMGMLFGGLIVFGILLLVVLTLGLKFHYYLAGVLTMMLIYHTLNYNLLK